MSPGAGPFGPARRVVLSTSRISKSFMGVHALRDVSFDLEAGEVHALMGENGAGKSTLMKIVSGVYNDHEGVLRVGGEPVRFSGVRDAEAAGIAIIHQELNLVPELSVAENVFLGREPLLAGLIVDSRRSNWWRSPRPCPSRLGSWSWTSRPPPCRRQNASACLRSSGSCPPRGWGLSTSRTAWTR